MPPATFTFGRLKSDYVRRTRKSATHSRHDGGILRVHQPSSRSDALTKKIHTSPWSMLGQKPLRMRVQTCVVVVASRSLKEGPTTLAPRYGALSVSTSRVRDSRRATTRAARDNSHLSGKPNIPVRTPRVSRGTRSKATSQHAFRRATNQPSSFELKICRLVRCSAQGPLAGHQGPPLSTKILSNCWCAVTLPWPPSNHMRARLLRPV